MSEERDPVVTQSVLQSELKILKSELTDLEKRLEKRISEDGALTRAHFDIMVEKVNDSVRLVRRNAISTFRLKAETTR